MAKRTKRGTLSVAKSAARTSRLKRKSLNHSFSVARATKQDEFYTQLADIENELRHYTRHLTNKVVFCNCDDPTISNFFHYFSHRLESLQLKKLITTCYKNCDADLFSKNAATSGIYLNYEGDKNGNRIPDPEEIGIHPLKGDGDFRSAECVALLAQSDIVVTNPPFSLFREYVAQLVTAKKQFVIIGNHNVLSYKEIFQLIKKDKLWLGYSHPVAFRVPDHYEMRSVRSWRDEDGNNWRSLGNACWFTNLDIDKRHNELILYKHYSPTLYPRYDHYDAIDVSRVADIPLDYKGAMGVPITFLEKYNPEQFEILDANDLRRSKSVPIKAHGLVKDKDSAVNGRPRYVRIPIRHRFV